MLIEVNQAGHHGCGARCARHRSSVEILLLRAHARILRSHQPASIVQIAFGFRVLQLCFSHRAEQRGEAGPQFASGNIWGWGGGQEETYKVETATFS